MNPADYSDQNIYNATPDNPTPTTTQDIPTPPVAEEVSEPATIQVGSDLNLDTQTVDFGDEPEQHEDAPEEAVDIDKFMGDASKERKRAENITSERCMAVPLSKIDDLANHIRSEINPLTEEARHERYMNPDDDLSAMVDATEEYTRARQSQLDSLKKVNVEKLKRRVDGVGVNNATIRSRFKDTDFVDVSGDDGRLVFASVLGSGMRRIPLWNSGITITLRPLSLDILHQYYMEVNTQDYEYGKEFGFFYYLFADLSISEYIISRLLPVAICGSNYANWTNMQSLLNVISFQDYPTILWAMATMMYPNGADIKFVCTEPGCGHVTKERVDLSKLRLLNTDKITPEMVEFFKLNRKLTDEDIAEYKSKLPFNNKVEFSYGEDHTPSYRKWAIYLKQPSLLEWRTVGRDYNGELRKNSDVTNAEAVTTYMFYNYFRSYKPWIDKIQLSVYVDKSSLKTISVTNDGTPANNATVYDCLNDLQMEYREFENLIRDYIADTQISHLCFYYPKCPKCGTEPPASYHGYIPYDPQKAFFILALTMLARGASRQEENS